MLWETLSRLWLESRRFCAEGEQLLSGAGFPCTCTCSSPHFLCWVELAADTVWLPRFLCGKRQLFFFSSGYRGFLFLAKFSELPMEFVQFVKHSSVASSFQSLQYLGVRFASVFVRLFTCAFCLLRGSYTKHPLHVLISSSFWVCRHSHQDFSVDLWSCLEVCF